MTHALKLERRKLVAAAPFIAVWEQVTYERWDWFIPPSLRPLRILPQQKVAALDFCFVRGHDGCGHRPVQGADEFERFAG